MKILVFSDSHGCCEKMIALITQFKAKNGTLDYIIHLGDLVRDAEELKKKFPEIPVLHVCGNNDFSFDIKDNEKEYVIGGKKFFILHGHTRRVIFSPDSLKSIAEQKKYDMILYGHTHIPREDYHEGAYIVCPGSISRDRSGKGTSYCVIDITGKDMCANIILTNPI